MDRLFRVSDGGEPFWVVARGTAFHRAELRGQITDGYERGAELRGGLAGLRILAPASPQKIVCVGLNYRDHALEMKKPLPPEPMLFLKPSTTVIGPGEPIRLPPGVGRVDHEAELAVVIGRAAHRVSASEAWNHILGVTCVNDVTARDIQHREVQYTRAKGFDTFAPIGPCIAIASKAIDRHVSGFVNGVRRQHSSSAQLIFSVEFLVEYISFVMTLMPGDVISTGTPAGVGPLTGGDVVTVSVEGVGDLSNPVVQE